MDEIREAWSLWATQWECSEWFERDCWRWLLAEARWHAEEWRLEVPYPLRELHSFPWES